MKKLKGNKFKDFKVGDVCYYFHDPEYKFRVLELLEDLGAFKYCHNNDPTNEPCAYTLSPDDDFLVIEGSAAEQQLKGLFSDLDAKMKVVVKNLKDVIKLGKSSGIEDFFSNWNGAPFGEFIETCQEVCPGWTSSSTHC